MHYRCQECLHQQNCSLIFKTNATLKIKSGSTVFQVQIKSGPRAPCRQLFNGGIALCNAFMLLNEARCLSRLTVVLNQEDGGGRVLSGETASSLCWNGEADRLTRLKIWSQGTRPIKRRRNLSATIYRFQRRARKRTDQTGERKTSYKSARKISTEPLYVLGDVAYL